MRARSLITGGSGFIGSHLAERLAAAGHEVTSLDLHVPAAAAVPGVTYVTGSVTDAVLVDALAAEHDHIFHLAAMLGVKRTMSEPAEMIENNAEGTTNVLRAALRHGRKVVFASTSEVYGKGQPPFREDGDILLGPSEKLRWSYATAKLLEEFQCLGYARRGLPVTILRYFNVYGPRQKDGAYGGVVPRFIRAALAGRDIEVFGNGEQTRCFTYAGDAAEATYRALSAAADGAVINIGSDAEIPILKLAELVKELAGGPSRIVKRPYEQVFPFGFEEIPRRQPDTSKLQTLLGFQPQIELADGLRRTIQWYRSNAAAEEGDPV